MKVSFNIDPKMCVCASCGTDWRELSVLVGPYWSVGKNFAELNSDDVVDKIVCEHCGNTFCLDDILVTSQH
jgi:hypothetical protein